MEETIGHEAVFRAIPGWEGYYSATSDGRVYKHPTKKKQGYFVGTGRETDYVRIRLYKDGQDYYEYVHRLVALTFHPNTQNKPEVNHKNCNKHDNRAENLEWMTRRENWNHARDHGRYRGKMLSEEEQFELHGLYSSGKLTVRQLVTKFGVSKSSVYRHIKKHSNIRLAA